MDSFAAVRMRALERRRALGVADDVPCPAATLLDLAYQGTGLGRQAVPDQDPTLGGTEALLDLDVPAIFYKQSTPTDLAFVHQAHEFGHYWIDGERSACDASDLSNQLAENPPPFGAQRVEGYSPHQHRECAANVFAREFLLPTPAARSMVLAGGLKGEQIAAQLGLPLALVHHQLGRALLLPVPAESSSEDDTRAAPSLDPSQREAAEAPTGPLLIEAGPGTGKTRTLVARIAWLCRRGDDPASILALTYSNKAAGELRERVAEELPAEAAALWAGTFHAFGLDLLRQYGDRIGLPANPQILGLEGGLGLLEGVLSTLPLRHYLLLHEPTLALADLLKAIGRAKDELVSPARYRELALAMKDAALTPQEVETAERAEEVAAIYAAYETALADSRALDFGDLLKRAVELLTDHPDVRAEVQGRFQHVLVDEFQDVNSASGTLLRLIGGDGKRLWVVGDARQSIYRFLGAAPRNIRAFFAQYPETKRRALSTNYRSAQPVVSLVEAFAPHMQASAGGLPAKWQADRGTADGRIILSIASSAAAEARGLADAIRANRASGLPYRDQAILCRSHTNLARLALLLEAEGIPILYLGDLFERPEIRDLLSLLSLASEPNSSGLLRVAGFPEYDVPAADVATLVAYANANDVALSDIPFNHRDAALSAKGSSGLARIAAHLDGAPTSPIAFFSTYLFERRSYLNPLLANDDVASQQARLAIYQFLQVALGFNAPHGADPRRAFLDWVRRLELFGEERQLRAPPAAADAIDAVRLQTVHASKGLEFGAVYLPCLATGTFPTSRKYSPCPPPSGLISGAGPGDHDEEEECLFFVGLSRARDYLHLSRAQRYGANRGPSGFLTKLTADLPSDPLGTPCWTEEGSAASRSSALAEFAEQRDLHRAEDLDQYLRCPRTYLYQRVIGLPGGREDNGYVRFHRAVYSVIRALAGGATLTLAEALQSLEEAWQRIGPVGHPFEPVYRREAERLVERAVARWDGVEAERPEWQIAQPNGTILVRPDLVELRDGRLIAQRIRTGRQPKTPPDDDIYALYHSAARQHASAVSVEVVYLGSDTTVEVPMTDRVIGNRLAKYDDAMRAIAAGEYPPKTDERTCPRCPQYFICPAPL